MLSCVRMLSWLLCLCMIQSQKDGDKKKCLMVLWTNANWGGAPWVFFFPIWFWSEALQRRTPCQIPRTNLLCQQLLKPPLTEIITPSVSITATTQALADPFFIVPECFSTPSLLASSPFLFHFPLSQLRLPITATSHKSQGQIAMSGFVCVCNNLC